MADDTATATATEQPSSLQGIEYEAIRFRRC